MTDLTLSDVHTTTEECTVEESAIVTKLDGHPLKVEHHSERGSSFSTEAELAVSDTKGVKYECTTNTSSDQLATLSKVRTLSDNEDSMRDDNHAGKWGGCVSQGNNGGKSGVVEGDDSYDNNGQTETADGGLFEVAQSGNMSMIENYLDLGFPPDLVDDEGWSILHHAALHGQVEVIKLLHSRGCSVDLVDRHGRTPLHFAAASGACGSIGVLIELGSNVNHVDNEGNTPLKWSLMCERYAAMEELLKYGGVCKQGDRPSGTMSRWVPVPAPYMVDLLIQNLLFQSASTGDVQKVSAILEGGCPVDAVDGDGGTALHRAASGGHVDMVGVLVERGASVDARSSDGRTPLHLAVSNGHLGVVCELLRLGAKASMTVVAGEHGTPLHQAALKGHKEMVSLLLDVVCPIDVVDINGSNALHYAARGGAVEVIGFLMEHGLNVNGENYDGRTPLHSASYCGKLEAVRELLRLGANASMTVVAGNGGTPLHQAALEGHKEIVSVLLDAGCPIDVVDIKGFSALHFAAGGGAVEVIDLLIGRGLDDNRKDNVGLTPLHVASACSKLEAVRELLRLGTKVSMTVVAGTVGTPLHQAAMKGHKEIVSVLLDAGCPIDVVDIEGRSALYYAAAGGAVELVGVLIERGLDVNRKANDGLTPLHVASVCGKLEAVCELLRLGANASMTVVAGRYGTPLYQAAMKGHKEIVSVLLDAGCPIDVVNIEGLSALHYAAIGGSLEVVEVLSEAMFSSTAQQPADSKVQEKFINKMQHGSTTSKNPLDCCSSAGYTPAMLAAMVGSVEVLKLLVSKHCDTSLRSSFDLSIVEHAIMAGQMSKLLDISKVFGIHTENVSTLLPALQERKLLDPGKLLILASFAGDPLVLDTLSCEESVFTEAAHQTWTTTRRVLFEYYQDFDKEAIYDQVVLPNECPLSPLHISLILLKYKTEYCMENGFIKAFHSSPEDNKPYMEKLISHPLTQFTVNELFPNGLSPLDVARQFNFHDIACMIERAGGGPGMWADLPKEIKEKGISSLVSLKSLLSHDTGGQEAALRIVSHLFGGLPSVTSAEDDARGKILQSKPELRHIVKHVLSRLHHLDRWFDVGVLLGVEEDELLTIQSDSKQVAYRTMLSTWLKHGRHVTWKCLLDAVGHYEPENTMGEMRGNIAKELTHDQSQDEAIAYMVVEEMAASEVRRDQTVMLSSLNTKPLVNASLIQPPCCEPAVPRPHPPLECLSSVQQTPFGVSSVQDTAPSDAELAEVLEHVPVWDTLAVKLGVPINTVLSLQHQTMGGLLALQHWRNGLSGEGYPTTWRFLLETVRKTQNLGPLVSDKLREEMCAKRTVCVSTRQYPHHVMSRPHPPLNPLSPGHVVPDSSSVEGDFEDHSPTKPALLAVVNEVGDDGFDLCIKFGVPISQASVYTADRSILGLNYWLSSRSGEGFPATWRFLLDAVSSVCGRVVSSTLEEQARRNPQWCSRRV